MINQPAINHGFAVAVDENRHAKDLGGVQGWSRGHTPLFHTVNSNGNRSEPIMRMLLDAGADASLRLDGLYWGKGYPWETVFFDVTPLSFAQLGLLPQVHRIERDIYSNIRHLVARCGRIMPSLDNIPNRYLARG